MITALMHHIQATDEVFGTNGPAQFPAGDTERFSSTSNGHRSLPHAWQRP